MRSHVTRGFRVSFAALPARVQTQARAAFKLFVHNPFHPSLHFKRVHTSKPIYSVRVGTDYRAVATREGQEVIWFWIGSHKDYDRLLSKM